MSERKIPFGKSFLSGKELEYIAAAVESGSIAGGGLFTGRCQSWLERNLGTHKALLTHSCTGALEMASILAGIGPGDEVIMPSFTFVSTANAFVLRGAVPVFVDIRPDTLNMDETLIAAAVSDRTKAIVPVHYAGDACAMDEIMAVAEAYSLTVIEDAAQSLLSSHRSRSLGTIGQMGCLSFHETKNIISGEGGALLVNREELAERAEIIWEKGTDRRKFFRGLVDKYRWIDIGSSFLPSELTAAFLFAQLESAARINGKRLMLANTYYQRLLPLADMGLISLPRPASLTQGNGHIFWLLTETASVRNTLLDGLRARGIGAVFHYVPLHDSPAGLRHGRATGDLPVTSDIAHRLIRLPIYFEMGLDDVDYVCKAIFEILTSINRL